MPSNATLVRTTEFGARPLGVRGEPLHTTHAQIRDVVRRRLGDRHGRLLAEPQAYPATGRIDWYADGGPVRAAADLPPAERDALRAEIDGMLAGIDGVGSQLEQSPGEDARLAGRALRLAARRPDDDAYLFRVGAQPVLICWGYDKESVGAILPPAFLPGAAPTVTATPVAPPVAAMPTAMPPAIAAAVAPARGRFPWLAALLVGLLGIPLILGAAYGLRLFLPVPPELQVTELPPEPPPPPAPPDPALGLTAAVDDERAREGKLKASLASLRDEVQQRQALCKKPEPPPPPPDPPKPPLAEKKPEPPKPEPKPKPKVAEAPKPPPPPPPPSAPPVTQPPPGTLPCNADTASGGAGVTRNRHYVGDKPGQVIIRYNMKTIPDQMNVYYRGRLVATTGRPTSRLGGLTFDFRPEAGDNTVVVEVVGPHHGTEWRYRLDCPA